MVTLVFTHDSKLPESRKKLRVTPSEQFRKLSTILPYGQLSIDRVGWECFDFVAFAPFVLSRFALLGLGMLRDSDQTSGDCCGGPFGAAFASIAPGFAPLFTLRR